MDMERTLNIYTPTNLIAGIISASIHSLPAYCHPVSVAESYQQDMRYAYRVASSLLVAHSSYLIRFSAASCSYQWLVV